MFSGESEHAVDEKGRIVIPPKFRDILGRSFILTQGFDGCLIAYPPDRFQQVAEELQKLSYSQARHRNIQRLMLYSAEPCEIDKQGRVLIPIGLRASAVIQREVVIVGLIDKLEIWAKQKWQEYLSQARPNFEELAEGLDGIRL
jgi:MraZ protein